MKYTPVWYGIEQTTAVKSLQLGEISCQFLPPGGILGLKYVLQLSFSKNYKIANNLATIEAREKISTYLESLEF